MNPYGEFVLFLLYTLILFINYNNDLNDPNNGLRHLSDTYYANGLVYRGLAGDLVNACYDIGWYYVNGSESNHPLRGYAGFLISVHPYTSGNYCIIKVLFLINTYVYLSAQNKDGSIINPYTVIAHG